MRLVVTGTDGWKDVEAVWRELEPLHKEHGQRLLVAYAPSEKGVGACCRILCTGLGIDHIEFPLNTQRDGGALFRDKVMLRMVKPDLVLAFHPFISASTNTKAVLLEADSMQVPVKIVKA